MYFFGFRLFRPGTNYYDGSYNNYDGNNGFAYTGTYTLSANDFGVNGLVDWFGAQAYVSYLNTINYGGSNHWALPTTPDSYFSYGFNQTTSQLGELHYIELQTTAYPEVNFGILGTAATGSDASGTVVPFRNAHTYAYWSGTEYASNPCDAWSYYTDNGNQTSYYKNGQFYAWAVSPGQVPTVPVPGPVCLALDYSVFWA